MPANDSRELSQQAQPAMRKKGGRAQALTQPSPRGRGLDQIKRAWDYLRMIRHLKNVGLVVVALGLLSTLAILMSSMSGHVDVLEVLFIVWVLSPYIVLLVSNLKIHQTGASDSFRIACFVASMLVITATLITYYYCMFVSLSSTAGLIFIFWPLYSLAAIAVIYFLSWLSIRFRRSAL